MNLIAWLKYELSHNGSAVQHSNHEDTLLITCGSQNFCNILAALNSFADVIKMIHWYFPSVTRQICLGAQPWNLLFWAYLTLPDHQDSCNQRKISWTVYFLYFDQLHFYLSHNKCLDVPVVDWLLSQEMDTATRVQILDETDCISHSTNTLGKGMNPIILPPAMGR